MGVTGKVRKQGGFMYLEPLKDKPLTTGAQRPADLGLPPPGRPQECPGLARTLVRDRGCRRRRTLPWVRQPQVQILEHRSIDSEDGT